VPEFRFAAPLRFSHDIIGLRIARTSQAGGVRLRFARHAISGPSGSCEGFAPTCSTRGFQFFPRK
jgi:hypothetical protein